MDQGVESLARLRRTFALLVVTWLLGGCATPPSENNSPSAAPDQTRAAVPGASGGTLTLSEKEFSITPATLSIKSAGRVVMIVRNDGQRSHSLQITRPGYRFASSLVNPLGSTSAVVTLAPGSYRLICPIENHVQLGMVAELIVTP